MLRLLLFPTFFSIFGAIGSIVGAVIGRKSQQDTNVANAEQAARQMDFQREMANTAHQREVADLRAAGLNPILSATGGSGAATPSGAMARMDSPDAALVEGVSSAVAANRARQEIKNMKAQEILTRDQQDATRSQNSLNNATVNLREMESDFMREHARTEAQRTRAERSHADILHHSAKGAAVEGAIDSSPYGQSIRFLQRLNPLRQLPGLPRSR